MARKDDRRVLPGAYLTDNNKALICDAFISSCDSITLMNVRLASLTLKLFIVVAFATSLCLQMLVLPRLASVVVERFPEAAGLRWPLLGGSIVWLALFQLALICVWQLLRSADRGVLFTSASGAWVDRSVYCLLAMCALEAAFVIIDMALTLGPISVPLAAMAALALSLGFLALVCVLRTLLQQATQLETDLEGVI